MPFPCFKLLVTFGIISRDGDFNICFAQGYKICATCGLSNSMNEKRKKNMKKVEERLITVIQ